MKAYGNNFIDFDNLTNEQSDKVGKVVKVLTEYIAEQKAVRDSMAATLDDLAADLDADKESTTKLKKVAKKAASVIANNKATDLRGDNTAIERLLEKMGEL